MDATSIVPGMAWLRGTGPEGKACEQCGHATGVSRGKLRCRRSKPVNGKFIPFPDWTESCRHFEARPQT